MKTKCRRARKHRREGCRTTTLLGPTGGTESGLLNLSTPKFSDAFVAVFIQLYTCRGGHPSVPTDVVPKAKVRYIH